MKYNKIIYCLILFIITIINVINFYSFKNYIYEQAEIRKESYRNCLNVDNEICKEILKEREEYDKCKKDNSANCITVKNNYNLIKTNELTFEEVIDTDISTFAPIISFLVILFSSMVATYHFKSLTIKNYLNRIAYNSYVKKVYKKCIYSLFIPILFNLLLIISTLLITKSFDLSFVLNKRFLLLYFINPLLQSLFLINIAYVLSLGSKNNIISFAKTSALYIITIFVVGSVHFLFKKIGVEQINMFDLINYSGVNSITIIFTVLISLILTIVSTLALYIIFKNKERVITIMEGENL